MMRGHGVGGGGNDHQVDLFRQIANAGVSLDSQHVRALGVHRKNSSSKRAAQQVPQNRTAHAARALGGADDGNAFGKKQGIQRMTFGAVDVGRRISFYYGCRFCNRCHNSSGMKLQFKPRDDAAWVKESRKNVIRVTMRLLWICTIGKLRTGCSSSSNCGAVCGTVTTQKHLK